jgi:hypothetical protein
MNYKFNPFTGTFDEVGSSTTIPPFTKFISVSASGVVTETTANIGMYTSLTDVSTGSSATIDIYITDDGTSTGVKLFDNLSNCSIAPAVRNDTGANDQSPWVHLREVSNSDGRIRLQIKKSNAQNQPLFSRFYSGNLDNNLSCTIHLTVTGKLN